MQSPTEQPYMVICYQALKSKYLHSTPKPVDYLFDVVKRPERVQIKPKLIIKTKFHSDDSQ